MGTEPVLHDADVKADAISHVEDAAPDYARNIYAKFVFHQTRPLLNAQVENQG
jgi:hypothetical protein